MSKPLSPSPYAAMLRRCFAASPHFLPKKWGEKGEKTAEIRMCWDAAVQYTDSIPTHPDF